MFNSINVVATGCFMWIGSISITCYLWCSVYTISAYRYSILLSRRAIVPSPLWLLTKYRTAGRETWLLQRPGNISGRQDACARTWALPVFVG